MTTNRGARTPRELLSTFVARLAARDVVGISEAYATDAVVSLPHGREAAGSSAIAAAYGAAVAGGAVLAVDAAADHTTLGELVDGARIIETGPLCMVSFTGADGVVRTMVAWRGVDGWAWVRDGSMLRDVEAALGAGLFDVA